MTAYDLDLLTGIAQHLHAREIATWSAEGIYTPDQTGIILDWLPDTPDAAIALTAYPVTDDVTASMATVGVQVRCRKAGANPTACRELTTNVFLDLHGRTAWTLPTGLRVVQIYRRSAESPTRDGSNRWTSNQNYYADVYIPPMHQQPAEEPTP